MERRSPKRTLAQAENIELRGFKRTLAEIECLLVLLVVMYLALPGARVEHAGAILAACGLFGLLALATRYTGLARLGARPTLAVEALAMTVLTASVVVSTGGPESPLVNLYLLVVIFSAITLGKAVTLLVVGLIASFYVHAAYLSLGALSFSPDMMSRLVLNFAPFLLVAYVTSLLAADMNNARAAMKALSETDELTGLLNMRGFTTAHGVQHRLAERHAATYAVMMIDADNLKPINDRLGHDAGNAMIRHIARIIRSGVREPDVVARFGGDEFVVLLPDTGVEEAAEVAERVRRAVAQAPLEVDGGSICASVSVGYAVYPHAARDDQELLAHADCALYASKSAGRNTVRHSADAARAG